MRFVKREKRGDVVARLDQIADWGAKLAAAKAAARPPHCQKGDTPCFLYVWQGKELRVNFADVWQGKELGLKPERCNVCKRKGSFGEQ